jgi:hypothetical protein
MQPAQYSHKQNFVITETTAKMHAHVKEHGFFTVDVRQLNLINDSYRFCCACSYNSTNKQSIRCARSGRSGRS